MDFEGNESESSETKSSLYDVPLGQKQPGEGRITGPPPAPVVKSIEQMNDVELVSEMYDEVEKLREIDPDGDDDYYAFDEDSVTVPLVEGTKTLRLLNGGNLEEGCRLLLKTAEAAASLPEMDHTVSVQRVNLLRQYISTVRPGDDAALDFLCGVTRQIFALRNQDGYSA